MKVLVTGATGYLGSNLVRKFFERGFEVVIIKRSFSNTQRIKDILPYLTFYDIDKCNLEDSFRNEVRFDAVIHTATCYGRKNESFNTIFETNICFPIKLLELASRYHVTMFLNTDTILNKDINAYALSKNQFVDWGEIYAQSHKIKFINIKLEHFYGPGDDDSKFTTYIIKNCMNNTCEINLTAGEQKRDFIYIDDVVSAYLVILKAMIYKKDDISEFELGSGMTISIRDFVQLVHKITGSKTVLNFGFLPYRQNEKMESKANIQSLYLLGWECKTSLTEGLKKTIAGL
jgi:CDP-paratose synthetase